MSDTTQHDTYLATCGHEDMIGWMVGLPCGDCTRKAHRKVTHPSPKQGTRK